MIKLKGGEKIKNEKNKSNKNIWMDNCYFIFA